jgi:hypothetical protein
MANPISAGSAKATMIANPPPCRSRPETLMVFSDNPSEWLVKAAFNDDNWLFHIIAQTVG